MPDVKLRSADGGEFSAYLSLPPSGSRKVPGIVMMQQIFGVNAEMRGFTDDFAAHGYIAICPDLYWRQEPGIELRPGAPGAFEKAVSIGRGVDALKAVEDLKVAVAYLRQHPACSGKVGTVGYCLGGLLAFLMSARSDADCNVGYFAVRMEKHIEDASKVKKPLMLHIPEKDRHVPPEVQALIKQHLKGRAELLLYPEADHAFNRVDAASYNKDVTNIAYERTAAFLRQHLG